MLVTRVAEKKLIADLIHRCDLEFVLPLEEDFGNHEWLWFPCISPVELEAWWAALEDVETFWREDTREKWPGELVRVDENLELSRLWEGLWNNGAHRVRVGLNQQFDLTEPDTYLRMPDGKIVLHKGAFELEDARCSDTSLVEPLEPD